MDLETKDESIKAWVTKYALTAGIKCVEGKVRHSVDSEMLSYGIGIGQCVFRNEWQRTPEAALARAEEMRKAKIASLKKSITKLEALELVVPTTI